MFHFDRPLSSRIHRAVVTYVTQIFFVAFYSHLIFSSHPYLFTLMTPDLSSFWKLLQGHESQCPLLLLKMECRWDGMLLNTIRRCLFNVLSVKLSNFVGTLHAPRTFVKTLITICMRLFIAKMLFCLSVQSKSPKKVQWIIHSDYKRKKICVAFF